MEEEWRDVVGYEGLYQVSNMGRVKSLYRLGRNKFNNKGKILKPRPNKDGYLQVILHKEGKSKIKYIHRLVAQKFIPNILQKLEVDHVNMIITDNRVENLCWKTRKENCMNPNTRNKMAQAKIGIYNTKKSKSVIQFSLDGKLIKEFPSVHEVERELGFANSNITNCCNGKHNQAYGFIWRYK